MTAAGRTRLDSELVRRGLAPSRTRAAALVSAGRVEVAGTAVHRPATPVAPDSVVAVRPAPGGRPDLVSRGGHKLAAALAAFGAPEPGAPDPAAGPTADPDPAGPALSVVGRRCLDAGASTGGFTDVLLRAGAAHVTAVDVGHGQLDARLRADPRVTAHEGVNVRDLVAVEVGGPFALTVADLSFIPLVLVLDALTAATAAGGDLVLLVKPQFEVGRERLGPGGVVRDPALHAEALHGVSAAALARGLRIRGAIRSPIAGQTGNVELLLWLDRRAGSGLRPDQAVRGALGG